MNKSDCLPIGTIVKTRGINGELIIEVADTNVFKNIKESILLEIDGLLVPFFITEFHQMSDTRARIIFDWTESEQKAKKLVNCEAYLPTKQLNITTETISPSILITFKVIDDNLGEIGQVSDYIENPANPLLVIKNKKNEIIIPFHQEFIMEVDPESKILYINTPEGLIDLYL